MIARARCVLSVLVLVTTLVAMAEDDLVVHEWGVFTVLNDAKYANANRKEEWTNMPPVPPTKPIRVGIAHHPNLQIEPALIERIAPLIRQLDDQKYDKREAASKALLDIGPLAIGMLRAELQKQPSPEQRQRMQAVLDRVDGMDWLKTSETSKK